MAKFDWENFRLKELGKRNGFESIERRDTESHYQKASQHQKTNHCQKTSCKSLIQQRNQKTEVEEGNICKFCKQWFKYIDLVRHYGECKKAKWHSKDEY